MRTVLFLVPALVSIAAAAPASAHHAFAAEYDAKKPVTLQGTIVRMDWFNPHAWLYVNVPQPDGKVVVWAVEFANPNQLLRRGWRRDDLPAGAPVTVKGYLARNGTPTANASTIVLASGKELFAGSPGDDDGR
jgi:hypothetical protein